MPNNNLFLDYRFNIYNVGTIQVTQSHVQLGILPHTGQYTTWAPHRLHNHMVFCHTLDTGQYTTWAPQGTSGLYLDERFCIDNIVCCIRVVIWQGLSYLIPALHFYEYIKNQQPAKVYMFFVEFELTKLFAKLYIIFIHF